MELVWGYGILCMLVIAGILSGKNVLLGWLIIFPALLGVTQLGTAINHAYQFLGMGPFGLFSFQMTVTWFLLILIPYLIARFVIKVTGIYREADSLREQGID